MLLNRVNSDRLLESHFVDIIWHCQEPSDVIRNYRALPEAIRQCEKLSDYIKNYLAMPKLSEIARSYLDLTEIPSQLPDNENI